MKERGRVRKRGREERKRILAHRSGSSREASWRWHQNGKCVREASSTAGLPYCQSPLLNQPTSTLISSEDGILES